MSQLHIIFLLIYFYLDSPALRDLNENFQCIAKDQEYKVLSFAETLPTSIGPMLKILVVPLQSAGRSEQLNNKQQQFFLIIILR